MEYQPAIGDRHGRRDPDQQGGNDEESQKTDWRFEIIEFQCGRKDEAAQASAMRVRAVVVIVAAPQIPNPQTIPQRRGDCRKASDR